MGIGAHEHRIDELIVPAPKRRTQDCVTAPPPEPT
jgi:hypothetical protein